MIEIGTCAERIELRQAGLPAGDHPRCFGRDQTVFDLWHYFPVLVRKPGALRNGAPFMDWLLPAGLERIRRKLAGSADGDRQMMSILTYVSFPLDYVSAADRPVTAKASRDGTWLAAWIGAAFAEADAEAAQKQWRSVADQLRPRVPKLAALMDTAEADVLAFMTFPKEHRAKIHSTNPLERLNGEIKRRTDVVGIFPNEAAVTRLVGAILLEQNDEWAIQRRYMTLETLAPISDAPPVSLPAVAA